MDCRLSRNFMKSRCKSLRKIIGKPKKELSWKDAKLRYPKLSPCGNADGDKVINKKDCRPFNKYMHMVKITENGETTVIVTPKEYLAYKKITYGRKLGLPPIETHKELKQDGLSSDEMRTGLALFEMAKNGANIEKDEGQLGLNQEQVARMSDPDKMNNWLQKIEQEGRERMSDRWY